MLNVTILKKLKLQKHDYFFQNFFEYVIENVVTKKNFYTIMKRFIGFRDIYDNKPSKIVKLVRSFCSEMDKFCFSLYFIKPCSRVLAEKMKVSERRIHIWLGLIPDRTPLEVKYVFTCWYRSLREKGKARKQKNRIVRDDNTAKNLQKIRANFFSLFGNARHSQKVFFLHFLPYIREKPCTVHVNCHFLRNASYVIGAEQKKMNRKIVG